MVPFITRCKRTECSGRYMRLHKSALHNGAVAYIVAHQTREYCCSLGSVRCVDVAQAGSLHNQQTAPRLELLWT